MSLQRVILKTFFKRCAHTSPQTAVFDPWVLGYIIGAALLLLPATGMAWELAVANPNAPAGLGGALVTGTSAPASLRVRVGNAAMLSGIDVYLSWIDVDAGPTEEAAFRSWIAGAGWVSGFHPVAPGPLDLDPFDPGDVTSLPETCPEGHRCFLACLAAPFESDPRLPESWLDLTVYPLSRQAALGRYPGQVFFLGGADQRNTVLAFSAQPAAPTNAEQDGTSGGAVTEKPDLVTLERDLLLYANGQAERFQVVDLRDPTAPVLLASAALEASPREIYFLDGRVYLLQTGSWDDAEGTRISVLELSTGGIVSTIQEIALPGTFLESRRRDRVIYAVSQETGGPCPGCVYDTPGQDVTVRAIRIGADGRVSPAEEATLSGYQPVVAIFANYLVCATGVFDEWGKTRIQVFDLTDPAGPLHPLAPVTVEGWIPSEFHVDVLGDHLRVVYGPEDRRSGSTLAIFDLMAGQNSPQAVGVLPGIAPGEALFATRFAEDRAYVVTYEQKDPLWVLDLSDTSSPQILGELDVPGWSELMFFHGHQLFAMGIDDVPVPEDEDPSVRRVSASLFDVENPAAPSLLARFTPMAGEVPFTASEALTDERALLLDWDDRYAAFPLDEWYSGLGSHVQILSLEGDALSDAGMVDTPVGIRRSIELGPALLTLLGDQELFTVDWSGPSPRILGDLELAANFTWLEWTQEGVLWAGSSGQNGLYRLFRFDPDSLETPERTWSLGESYDGILLADGKAVFYDLSPLVIRTLDLDSGTASLRQTLDSGDPPAAYRLTPMLHEHRFFVAEQVWQGTPERGADVWYPEPVGEQWILRAWNLTENGAVAQADRSIPGMPVALMEDGRLVCMEASSMGIQVHLVSLEAGGARLVTSRELACDPWGSTLAASADALYVACTPVLERPWLETTDSVPPGEEISLAEGGIAASEASPDEPPGLASPVPQPAPQGDTEVLRLDPAAGFSEAGRWTLNGTRRILAVRDNIALVASDWWFWDYTMYTMTPAAAGMPVLEGDPPIPRDMCTVYRFTADGAEELAGLDSCWDAQRIALTSDRAFTATGYAGIEAVSW